MKVLFVDDEPAVLEGFRRALRKEPYEVLTALSPTLALALLSEGPIDLVVSDERMPGGSGSEFLARIKRLYPQTIRILLTGEPGLEGALRAINEGNVYRFLHKPISTTELSEVIRNALRMKHVEELSARIHAAR